ncbi:MAG: hypothetical protein M3Z23_18470 [Acidobacteriota bacterium]|nr:hypothetical protein [Acidobacteriota bacterium]
MPEIQWKKLSKSSKQHLMDRLKGRHITASDLQALQEWILHSPQVPDGKWYKDFGTFKLCGEGGNPSTFLGKDQIPYGDEVE